MENDNIFRKEAMALSPQIIEWRRSLHRMPEVGLHLPQTREYIMKCLAEMGADCKALSSSSSILVSIKGGLPFIRKNEKVEDKKVLNLSRTVTVVVSLLGVGIALFSGSLVQMLYIGGLAYGTSVFIPMLAALYWKRGTAPAALVSMVAAMCVGLYWEFFISGKAAGIWGTIPSNIVAVAVSLILFVGVSLLTPKPSKEQLAVLTDNI